jgi:Flp pilus assembly protein TadG
VEFALLLPLLMFLVLMIGDFGRLYASAVAVESAAREAADYGAFLGSTAWSNANDPWDSLKAEMRRRACTAASTVADYAEPVGTVNHATCTNPDLTDPDWFGVVKDVGNGVTDCSDPEIGNGTKPPCIIHVKLKYTFHMFLAGVSLPGDLSLPGTFYVERHSRFAISDLPSS